MDIQEDEIKMKIEPPVFVSYAARDRSVTPLGMYLAALGDHWSV